MAFGKVKVPVPVLLMVPLPLMVPEIVKVSLPLAPLLALIVLVPLVATVPVILLVLLELESRIVPLVKVMLFVMADPNAAPNCKVEPLTVVALAPSDPEFRISSVPPPLTVLVLLMVSALFSVKVPAPDMVKEVSVRAPSELKASELLTFKVLAAPVIVPAVTSEPVRVVLAPSTTVPV